ncbi:hypothetical protein [Ferrimonas senticii]|uniref:hypothetical protein n=1 Tax=Ferrimonas senticii TaxID=394566 RepID=UPI0004265BFE|nr:hypothetical protein [Ferrimonas senticii]
MKEHSFTTIASCDTAESNSLKLLLKATAPFWLLALLFAFVTAIVRIDAMLGFSSTETSITELGQLSLLALICARLLYIAKSDRNIRQAATLMTAFFMVCAIRELDFLFDKLLHGSWIYPALVVTGLGILLSARPKGLVLKQLADILGSKAGALLMLSMAMLLVFSRLWGMGDFWTEVMGVEYMRAVKRTSEEGLELLSYTMIAYSVLQIKFIRD